MLQEACAAAHLPPIPSWPCFLCPSCCWPAGAAGGSLGWAWVFAHLLLLDCNLLLGGSQSFCYFITCSCRQQRLQLKRRTGLSSSLKIFTLTVSDSATPWPRAHQAALSMGFPRREHWSRLPSPGNLPDPGVEPMSCIGMRLLYH